MRETGETTYMQIATMTTFPGPCRNVVLWPDRGFMKDKRHYYSAVKRKQDLYYEAGLRA